MSGKTIYKFVLSFIGMLVFFVLPACTSAAPPVPTETLQAAPSETATPVMVTEMATNTLAPTQTSEPTSTAVPATATPIPSPTPLPELALMPEGVQAWCLPDTYRAVSSDTQAWVMPEGARAPEIVDDHMQLLYPSLSCTFTFTFNQAFPEGTSLAVYEAKYNASKPWLSAVLNPANDQPEIGYAVLKHTYIINPPLWEVSYRLTVQSPDGKEYWNDVVNFKRSWQMARCWNTTMPNPITLTCPVMTWGDIHPSDWGYGLPTSTPASKN